LRGAGRGAKEEVGVDSRSLSLIETYDRGNRDIPHLMEVGIDSLSLSLSKVSKNTYYRGKRDLL
jgi:ADP-ribose pyrophosphatase YjhB (NUDIX family)